MKVLLIQNDLYKNIGGGQTIYQKIIESSPNINFYYFISDENKEAERPKNAIPIELKYGYRKIQIPDNLIFPEYKKREIMEADRYARVVKDMEFDIADIPDYYTFGSYLYSAFKHNNVKVKRIVLAMHGNISTSIELNWGFEHSNTLEIRENEFEQFVCVDGVYSISPKYIDEWKAKHARDIYYIDPMNFVSYKLQSYKSNSMLPSLYCIARSERLKGGDLFIDIARWLKPNSYEKCIHIGDDVMIADGVTSGYHLSNIALEKDMSVQFLKPFDREKLNELFATKAMIILPVRYDTLNLVALEALFSGCPVAISTKAGVCKYLDTYYPQIPYVKIDFDNYGESISEIQEVLDNYDEYRNKLQLSLETIAIDKKTNVEVCKMYEHFLGQEQISRALEYNYITNNKSIVLLAKKIAWYLGLNKVRKLKQYISKIKGNLGSKTCKKVLKKLLCIENGALIAATYNSFNILKNQKSISKMSEQSLQHLYNKINALYDCCENQIDRCTYYNELARLLFKTNDPSFALTYMLRVLRLYGCENDSIQKINSLLVDLKFESKLKIVNLFCKKSEERNREYFISQFKDKLRNSIDDNYTIYEENRSGSAKVSIIISLYNAANKSDFFLSLLCRQSMVQNRSAEIIFIDSNSPLEEKIIVDKYNGYFDYVFVRTKNRETIQHAWNRGIALATGKYLSFLGVDEMIFPETLEELSLILDKKEDVDWVMSNSLVTKVQKNGIYEKSVMKYDRKNTNKNICYLESCYLSYVGGLYRKNIHERFGYYDANFRGAGDTEFKNRVLPYINIEFVDKTYGIFLDYPEERVTASPMAEIEDLEAWYAHRTYEGIGYAMQNANEEEIEKLFILALNYRKSYCHHYSSDLEYALTVGKFLLSKSPENLKATHLVPKLEACVQQLKNLEVLENKKSKIVGIVEIRKMLMLLSDLKTTAKELTGQDMIFEIFNDNRYEQHAWVWRAPQSE